MPTSFSITEQCIARLQITAVMHRYASLGRENCNWAELTNCFEEDATYQLPNGLELNPRNASQVVQGNEAPYIRHHITTIDIQFDSKTEAHSESFFFATTDSSSVDHWGSWKDIFRRQQDGSWLIHKRTITVDGYDPAGWTSKTWGDAVLTTGVNGKGKQ